MTVENPGAGEIEAALVAFITHDLGWDGEIEMLRAGAPLTEILDSQDLIETAGFAEDSFGVEIDDAEVNQQNFGSLGALVQFVVSKRETHADT